METKKTALVFGVSPDYDFALASVLIGLNKRSRKWKPDIHVFHNGVEKWRQDLISSIRPCNFIKYDRQLSTDMGSGRFLTGGNIRYSKYECYNMLSDYDHVIWLDVDIIICRSIAPLVDLSLPSGVAMMPRDRLVVSGTKIKEDDYYELDTEIPGASKAFFYNDGVVSLSKALPRHEERSSWVYDYIERHPDWFRGAQGPHNLMFLHFGDKVRPLAEAWNKRRGIKSSGVGGPEVRIAHYCTVRICKPWNVAEPMWIECAAKWNKIVKEETGKDDEKMPSRAKKALRARDV